MQSERPNRLRVTTFTFQGHRSLHNVVWFKTSVTYIVQAKEIPANPANISILGRPDVDGLDSQQRLTHRINHAGGPLLSLYCIQKAKLRNYPMLTEMKRYIVHFVVYWLAEIRPTSCI